MLRWGEGVDFAAPVGEFAAGDLIVDFLRDIIDHTARLAGDSVAVIDEILCTEGLDGE